MKTMNAIIVRQFGGPEVCEYTANVPIPEPNDHQVSNYQNTHLYIDEYKRHLLKVIFLKQSLYFDN